MNNKGQALIEFIIILPIFIMILLVVFDYVRIIETKILLENTMEEVILDSDYIPKDDITINKTSNGDYEKIELSKEISLSSPILSPILSNPYKVEISRSIHE